MDIISIILGIIIGAVIGWAMGNISYWKSIRKHRQDAISTSKSVILGSVSEKIVPMLPDFPYDSKDLVFIGKGFDYLVLDGLSKHNLQQIVFLEIKSGKSQLNTNEKYIKKIIEDKKVIFELMRV